jgi:hypothetical protein
MSYLTDFQNFQDRKSGEFGAARSRKSARRSAREFKALPAFPAGHQFIHANHVRPRQREALLVFFAGAARQFVLFCAHDPADRIVVFLAARWTGED